MAANEVLIDQERLAQFKECLAESKFRIKLDDLVNANIREALRLTADARFSPHGPINSGEDVATRLRAYEDALRHVQANATLLGKWAVAEQRPTLANMMTRIADNSVKGQSGNTVWLNMRWYPLSLLAYSAGIAALSAENYAAFAALHTARVELQTQRRGEQTAPVVVPLVDAMMEMGPGWKSLPGRERNRAPESEYMFKTLLPVLDELLFLGGSYEILFDRYEILRALAYADLTDCDWVPVGRFGWKHCSRGSGGSPYLSLRAEADERRDNWGPIQVGLFRGAYTRFDQVAKKFETELLGRLNWY